MTRVVCISDTHNVTPHSLISDGDILVHTGDLTKRGSLVEIDQAADWLRALPHRHKVVIAGNHDFGFQTDPELTRKMMYDLHYLQDSEVTIEGLRIYGSPWQPWFHDWAFNLPRKGAELEAKWDAVPAGIDVLLTHTPPHRVLDRTVRGENVGCELLKKALTRIKPQLNVFGHIHEAYGQRQVGDTLCVNASVCTLRYQAMQAPVVVDFRNGRLVHRT